MKLNDAFENWEVDGGIFHFLQSLNVPWKSSNYANSLDRLYHGNHSGRKLVSPLVYDKADGEPLTQADRTALANSIFNVFRKSWEKLYATLSEQYDPISNYDMTETLTNDTTTDKHGKITTRTDNLKHTKTGTETETPDTTETETPDLTTENDNSIYGFNSVDAVPTGEQSTKQTGTNTRKKTGTDEVEYDTTDEDTGTQKFADTGTDTRTRNYTLKRSGNIGVTTSQQMLQSERDLWQWSFFYDVVFPDLDRVLTIPIY